MHELRAWMFLVFLLFLPPLLTSLSYLYDSEAFINSAVLSSIATQDAVDERAASVWMALIQGGFFAVVAADLVALGWVAFAQRTRPVDDWTARSQRRSWWLALVLALIASVLVAYYVADRSPTVAPEDPSVYAQLSAGIPIVLAVVAAFWCATGLLVRPALRPSVPFAVQTYPS